MREDVHRLHAAAAEELGPVRLEPGYGVDLVGEVGLTSHIADVMRKANVPARIGLSMSKAA